MASSNDHRPFNWRLSIFNTVRDFFVIIFMVTVVHVALVQAYHVPTGSMEHTIMPGDFVVAEKVTLGPRTPHWIGIPYTGLGMHVPALKLPGLREVQPGDVVVVETPVDEQTPYVKRVAAVSGQTLELRNKTLFINGVRAPEDLQGVHLDARTLPDGFPQPGIPRELGNRDNWGPYNVPDKHVFLMGDNRDNSMDSRYFGPVHVDAIIGRVIGVAMSWNTREFLDGPDLSRIAKRVD